MVRWVWKASILVLLVACGGRLHALDPALTLSQYGLSRHQLSAAAGDNGITLLTRMRDGYVWVGTKHGPYWFDGSAFLRPESAIGNELDGETVTAATESVGGAAWVGTSNRGLWRFEHGRSQHFDGGDGLAADGISQILASHDGSIWVACPEGGLSHLAQGHITTYREAQGLPTHIVGTMIEDRTGAIWLGTAAGIAVLEHGAVVHDQRSLLRQLVSRFAITRDGTLWAATLSGVYRWDGKTWSAFRKSGLGSSRIYDMVSDHDAGLWLLTESSLVRVSGDRVERFDGNDNAPRDASALFSDADGSLWISTRAGELLHFTDGQFLTLTTRQGLASDFAYAATQTADGTMWLATYGGVLSEQRVGGKRWKLRGNRVFFLAADADGSIWASTEGGLERVDRSGPHLVGSEPSGATNVFNAAAHDGTGGLWFARADGGLWKVHGGGLDEVPPRSELRSLHITALLARDDGALWIAAQNGLFLFANGMLTRVQPPHGFESAAVNAIATIGAKLWVSFRSKGLYQFGEGRWTALKTEPAGVGANILHITPDNMGRVWLSTIEELYAVTAEAAQNTFGSSALRLTDYGRADGLTTSSVLGTSGAVFTDRSGQVWFATTHGFAVLHRLPVHDAGEGRLRIDSARADGRERYVLSTPQVSIEAGASRVEFHWTTPDYSPGAPRLFRYRLLPFETQWTDAGSAHLIAYTNLSPRKYTFEVAASRDGLNWSHPALLAVEQLPFFYQRLWFRLLLLVMAIIALMLLFRLRLLKLQSEYQAILKERSRISREIHDTLLQSTTGVAYQLQALASVSKEPERSALEGLLGALRRSTAEVRGAVWGLRSTPDEMLTLEMPLKDIVERLPHEDGIAGRFTRSGEPHELAPAAVYELVRIAQQATLNAVQHAQCETISVAIVWTTTELHLAVTDDGRGFVQTPESRSDRHFGLRTMRERAERLGGSLQIETALNTGSTIRVDMPLSRILVKRAFKLGRLFTV